MTGSLLDIVFPSAEIPNGFGGTLVLRGLNYRDASVVMLNHTSVLGKIWEETFAPVVDAVQEDSGGTLSKEQAVDAAIKQFAKAPTINVVPGGEAPKKSAKTKPKKTNKKAGGVAIAAKIRVDTIMEVLLKTAPEAVADIIALANDTYDGGGSLQAGKLPPQVQVNALLHISKMTFGADTNGKKGWEGIAEMVKMAFALVGNSVLSPEPSKSASGDGEAS